MMKQFKKVFGIVLSVLLLVGAVIFIVCGFKANNSTARYIYACLTIGCLIFSEEVMKRVLGKSPIKAGRFFFKSIIGGVFRFLVGTYQTIINFFDKIFNKLGFRVQGLNHISGYKDETFKVEKKQAKKLKQPKFGAWKNLSNRERIRCIYTNRIFKMVKNGYYFDKTNTALEIRDEAIEGKYEKSISEEERERYNRDYGGFNAADIYELYSVARYSDRQTVDERVVEWARHKYN